MKSIQRLHWVVFSTLVLMVLAIAALAQGVAARDEVPAAVQNFLNDMPPRANAQEFYRLVDEHVWKLYADPDVSRQALEAYLASSRETAGLAFTAIALIQFHNPASATAILSRALDEAIPSSARWYMLNAAPYVLSIGDVWYSGDGALGDRERKHSEQLMELAGDAVNTSMGNAHARNLLKLYDDALIRDVDRSELALARWHLSAYLLGTIDLRDYSLLESLLSAEVGLVAENLVRALSFAANRDFIAPLRGKVRNEETTELAAQLISQTKRWWANYLRDHPGGDWKPAAIEGFQQAGYMVSFDFRSEETLKELNRALESDSDILRYNTCKVLNVLYGTRFDLERIFLGKKYALGPFDPSGQMEAYEQRLIAYWKKRLDAELVN